MTLKALGGTVWRRGKRTKYNMESDPVAMEKEAVEILEAAEFVKKMQSDPEAVAEYEDYMQNVVMPYAFERYTSWRETPSFAIFEMFKSKYPSSETVRREVEMARLKLERKATLKSTKE